jgi:NTP pyrophosphatase (non-canonical NTP hydrolase)
MKNLNTNQPLHPSTLSDCHHISQFLHQTYPEQTKEVRVLAKLSKIQEELGELTNEVHAYLGFHQASPHKHDDPKNLGKEWADVILTIILLGTELDLNLNQELTERIKFIKQRYKLIEA